MGEKTEKIVADVKEFVEKQEKNTSSFREALDDVIPYYVLDYFTIPGYQKTDNYEIVNCNKPQIFADKIAHELAYGTLNHEIPLVDADSPLRKKESLTEQAVYAFDRMADEYLQSPFSPVSLQQLAWFVPVRAGVAGRLWFYKDENGKVIQDLAIWDWRNTYWTLGKGGRLNRVCYVRYASKEEIDEEYNMDSTADTNGMVKVYDDWVRSDKEITVGKGKLKKTFYPFVEQVTVGDEMVREMKLKKDYLPIYIASVGNMPLIQNTKSGIDMMKYLPQTFASHNKDIWKAESQLATYRLKTVRLATMAPFLKIKDSRLSGESIEIDKTPYKEGANIEIDVGKGQDIRPFFTPVSSPDAAVIEAEFAQWSSMGGASPVWLGQPSGDLTAQGTAMLIHASQGILKSGVRAIERFKTWQDNESIRQFKEGDFDEMQIEGVDGKGKQFSAKINRDSVTTDRQIVATLKLDSPQDELQLAGILHQYLADGVFSLQRAMDKAGVQDVDAEKDIRAREKLDAIFPFSMFNTIDACIKDKDPEMKKYGMLLMKMATDAMNQAMMQGQNAEIGRAQPQPNQLGIVAPPNPAANINPPVARNMMVKPGQNNPNVRG